LGVPRPTTKIFKAFIVRVLQVFVVSNARFAFFLYRFWYQHCDTGRSSPDKPALSGAKNEMRAHTMPAAQSRRIVAGLPFVEALARRMASTMPHSIDVGDLVQDGVIGLIDAAHRFDEGRGIKFETFAERRIRGAMIDALRKDAWPRGVRRVRRELEAARETLRRELGHEPSLSDLAAKVGTDEKRLGRTIVRIHTIESTSPWRQAKPLTKRVCRPRWFRRNRKRRMRLTSARSCRTRFASPSSRCRSGSRKSLLFITTAT
jgi:RNA polymerase sigma factor (sigma-70 family)